jgi:virulence-associated protein VagC
MRTTIDLPDELFRQLKARAALEGVSMKTMVLGFVEQGLHTHADVQAIDWSNAGLFALLDSAAEACAETPGPTATVVSTAHGQALRIPPAFELDATEVAISRNDRGELTLRPVRAARGQALLKALHSLDDAQFIATLEKSRADAAPDQHRESL